MSAPVATVLAHVAHTSGCRVLPTPLAANELGCQAAGLGTHDTGQQALEAVEQGTRARPWCCSAPTRSAAGRAATAGGG